MCEICTLPGQLLPSLSLPSDMRLLYTVNIREIAKKSS